MRLLLVRHGATGWNEGGRFLGRTDVPLSATGRRQAECLRAALSGERFDRVFSSPLSRAIETARLLGHEPELLPDLIEIDRGTWEGLDSGAIRLRDPALHRSWYEDPNGLAMPGGEAFGDLWERAGRALGVLAKAGERVLAVGHKAANRVVIARALGRDSKGVWGIAQPQACRTVLVGEGGRFRAEVLGDVSHLPPELRSDA
ncbi:MAG TPA: histidine phosphatase family protein [Planctomycetota bacterium]|nr:histidine phosphatase family protein [Planctomycetota bacterium]